MIWTPSQNSLLLIQTWSAGSGDFVRTSPISREVAFLGVPRRAGGRIFKCLYRSVPVSAISWIKPDHPGQAAGIERLHNPALGTRHQATGRSRGGLTGTNVAVCDALGHLVRFVFVSGQASDLTGTDALLAGLDFGAFIADRAFDVDRLRDGLAARRIAAVIPAKRTRLYPREYSRDLYGWLHQIETVLTQRKAFRGIATRTDKADASFTAAIHLAAGVRPDLGLSPRCGALPEDLKTAAWRNTGTSGMHSPQGSGSQRPVSPRGQCRLSKKDHYQ